MTSFLDIVGGMGPSSCIPGFMKNSFLLNPPFASFFNFSLSPLTSRGGRRYGVVGGGRCEGRRKGGKDGGGIL